jgi:Zn-dependent protease
MTCAQCNTEVAGTRLSCPVCHALIHAAQLKSLALAAETAAASGDLSAEISSWRQALPMLPAGSRQFEQISRKVADLSRRLDSAPALPPMPPEAHDPSAAKGRWKGKGSGVLATLGLLAWKLKTLLLVVLTKGKLLLLGLTHAGTLLSMALSFGVYWAIFGWPFAAGLILSLYIHEMGHVAALKRLGIPASLPMFLPGIGAVVRLRQHPASASEDARIGLAGPLWGMGAAIAAYLGFLAGGWPLLAAVARWGAWVNLFNLLPFWQLDGGRAFHALSRPQRIAAALVMGALWLWTREGMLILLLIVAAFRAFRHDAPAEGDRRAIFQYVLLLVVLAALCTIPVPGAGR